MSDAPSGVPENLTIGQWDPERWTSDPPAEAIHRLFTYVDDEATKAVRWYENAKRRMASASRGVRACAIVLFLLGGLAPIVSGIVGGLTTDKAVLTITQSGYGLIAVAAGLLAFDRYFGVSSGWIRYMTSLAAIERLRSEFVFDWTALLERTTAPIGSDAKLAFLARAQVFQKAVFEVVEKETTAWVAEFQSSIADLEKVVQAQRQAAEASTQAAIKQHEELRARLKKEDEDAQRKGAANIDVTGSVGPSIEVLIDRARVQEIVGRSGAIAGLAAGQREIGVRTVVNDRSVSTSRMVDIEAGKIAQVTLALPA
ncbi:MAG: SLATT domain-containing protein [Reyranellaceae bacterium]